MLSSVGSELTSSFFVTAKTIKSFLKCGFSPQHFLSHLHIHLLCLCQLTEAQEVNKCINRQLLLLAVMRAGSSWASSPHYSQKKKLLINDIVSEEHQISEEFFQYSGMASILSRDFHQFSKVDINFLWLQIQLLDTKRIWKISGLHSFHKDKYFISIFYTI